MLAGIRQFAIQEVPVPEPGPSEAVIQVEQCGICGTDVHIYNGANRIKPPVVMGHEFSGTLHALGRQVTGLRLGERVTVEPGVECGHCTYCESGRYNLCHSFYMIGGHPESPGAYAEFVRVPAAKVLPLPEGMSFPVAALIEPTACAMHALDAGRVEPGQRVLVIGAGTVGLLIAQTVRLAGASEVIVVDLVPERLAVARQVGADVTVDLRETDFVAWAEARFGRGGIPRVFDAVGSAKTLDLAFRSVRRGGRIVTMAVSQQTVEWQPGLLRFEVELTGMKMYTRRNFEQAIPAIHSGRVQVEPLISRSFPLERVDEAFQTVLTDNHRIKVLLAPGGNGL